mmetsp:Transcript_25172/g.54793  ORF Transcript_25172/g.54793 Transcript_25172/m.54793 type:complete len:215 (+) Transcript_25172:459-1103(+)
MPEVECQLPITPARKVTTLPPTAPNAPCSPCWVHPAPTRPTTSSSAGAAVLTESALRGRLGSGGAWGGGSRESSASSLKEPSRDDASEEVGGGGERALARPCNGALFLGGATFGVRPLRLKHVQRSLGLRCSGVRPGRLPRKGGRVLDAARQAAQAEGERGFLLLAVGSSREVGGATNISRSTTTPPPVRRRRRPLAARTARSAGFTSAPSGAY